VVQVPSGRGDRHRSAVAAIGLPILGFAAAVSLWWAAVIVFDVQPYLLPAPPEVVEALGRDPAYLLRQTGLTVVESITGYGLAAGVGMAAAALLASSKLVERTLFPLLLVFNAVPKVVVAPLLVIWFGFGTSPKVFMVALVCFFPIVLSTVTGLLSTPADLAELSASLTANRWQFLRKIQVRWALPHVFVGLKTAMFLATIGAIVGEFAGGSQGIGFVINQAAGGGDTALTMAGAVLISTAAIILYYLVVLVERLVVPWARDTTVVAR
jgi:NitT/TauT family transport system permease protein